MKIAIAISMATVAFARIQSHESDMNEMRTWQADKSVNKTHTIAACEELFAGGKGYEDPKAPHQQKSKYRPLPY